MLLALGTFVGIADNVPADHVVRSAVVLDCVQAPETNLTSDSRVDAQDFFANVKSSLLEKTQVPVRLPNFLPAAGDKDSPI